jgi:hypothetical protein
MNVEVRHLIYLNKLSLTFFKYAAAAFLTRLMRRGKRTGASEGMNGFESAVVSMSDFKALQSV